MFVLGYGSNTLFSDGVHETFVICMKNYHSYMSHDPLYNTIYAGSGATLDDVVHMAEKDRTTLLDAIKDLTDYQDEVGILFEKFSSLNATEQKVIDDAQKALERARIELEDAQKKPDTWWNNLWGRKSKIAKAEQALQTAEKTRAAADNKAKAMFQERIENADVQTLLKELSYKSQAAVTRLKNREIEIKEVEDKLVQK